MKNEENIKEFIECIQIIRESNPGLSIMGCIAKTEGMLKAKNLFGKARYKPRR